MPTFKEKVLQGLHQRISLKETMKASYIANDDWLQVFMAEIIIDELKTAYGAFEAIPEEV